ncbi:MAG: hypothetical protein NW220_03740 [Leptolyngbyaceae cyanobacterium bins.349]|nr:hypothetical protein [Leptolyngbyaceae cyanobacterium bins.349]
MSHSDLLTPDRRVDRMGFGKRCLGILNLELMKSQDRIVLG